jgi:hypothetical protein
MIAMKMLREAHGAMLVWPQLNATRISEALRPNLGVQVSHGAPIFALGYALLHPGRGEVIHGNLKYCANQRLPEITGAELLCTRHMVHLATCECFSHKRRNALTSHGNPGVNYALSPHLDIEDIVLTLRSWARRNDVANVDDWRWGEATKNGEWIRVLCCDEVRPRTKVCPNVASSFTQYH